MAGLARADPGACAAYWEWLCLRLQGDLDVEALRHALRTIVARHDALRTRLSADDLQEVLPAVDVEVPLEALAEGGVADWWRGIVEAATDLARTPLFRFALARTGAREHLLAFCTHHLVSDGWSIDVLLREAGAAYGARREGRPLTLPAPTQFRAWAAEAARGSAAAADAHLAHWEEVARGMGGASGARRGDPLAFRGARRSHILEGALVRRLRADAARRGGTLFMDLFGAFTHLLHEVYGSEVVVAGLSVACRTGPECEGTVGELAQVLPVVSRRAPSVAESIDRARDALLEVYAHADFPFALARSHLEARGLPVPEPLATLNLDPIAAAPAFPGLEVSVAPQPVFFVRRELSINLLPGPADGLLLDCDYRRDAFGDGEVDGIVGRFVALLAGLAEG